MIWPWHYFYSYHFFYFFLVSQPKGAGTQKRALTHTRRQPAQAGRRPQVGKKPAQAGFKPWAARWEPPPLTSKESDRSLLTRRQPAQVERMSTHVGKGVEKISTNIGKYGVPRVRTLDNQVRTTATYQRHENEDSLHSSNNHFLLWLDFHGESYIKENYFKILIHKKIILHGSWSAKTLPFRRTLVRHFPIINNIILQKKMVFSLPFWRKLLIPLFL